MSEVTVLALTGPPAAGKSTVVQVLEDIGVPCKDTGDAIREEAHERYDGTGEPDEDYIWNVAELIREEHGDAGPTAIAEDWIETQVMDNDEPVICVSSLREQAEVGWLREHVGRTLVIRVDADSHTRSERYVEMNIDEDRESVGYENVQQIREELYERELRESPYPDHEVTIRNENSVSMHELYRRLERLVEVLE